MSFVKYRYLIFGILGDAYVLVFFRRIQDVLAFSFCRTRRQCPG